MIKKLSYTPTEFAKLMGVGYSVVKYWLDHGKIPGAYQQGDGVVTIKRWRIPHEAVNMTRPRRGVPKGRSYYSLKDKLKDLQEKYDDLERKYDQLRIETGDQ